MQSLLATNNAVSSSVNDIQSYSKCLLSGQVSPIALEAAIQRVLEGLKALEGEVLKDTVSSRTTASLLDAQKHCAKASLQELQLRRDHAAASLVVVSGCCQEERHCPSCRGYLASVLRDRSSHTHGTDEQAGEQHPVEDEEEEEEILQSRIIRCQSFSRSLAELQATWQEYRERVEDILSELNE